MLDDGGLDQPADGVVVAEVVPAVVFHEARAGDQSREVPPKIDGDQRVVATVHHERRHRQLLEALLVGRELGGGPGVDGERLKTAGFDVSPSERWQILTPLRAVT